MALTKNQKIALTLIALALATSFVVTSTTATTKTVQNNLFKITMETGLVQCTDCYRYFNVSWKPQTINGTYLSNAIVPKNVSAFQVVIYDSGTRQPSSSVSGIELQYYSGGKWVSTKGKDLSFSKTPKRMRVHATMSPGKVDGEVSLSFNGKVLTIDPPWWQSTENNDIRLEEPNGVLLETSIPVNYAGVWQNKKTLNPGAGLDGTSDNISSIGMTFISTGTFISTVNVGLLRQGPNLTNGLSVNLYSAAPSGPGALIASKSLNPVYVYNGTGFSWAFDDSNVSFNQRVTEGALYFISVNASSGLGGPFYNVTFGLNDTPGAVLGTNVTLYFEYNHNGTWSHDSVFEAAAGTRPMNLLLRGTPGMTYSYTPEVPSTGAWYSAVHGMTFGAYSPFDTIEVAMSNGTDASGGWQTTFYVYDAQNTSIVQGTDDKRCEISGTVAASKLLRSGAATFYGNGTSCGSNCRYFNLSFAPIIPTEDRTCFLVRVAFNNSNHAIWSTHGDYMYGLESTVYEATGSPLTWGNDYEDDWYIKVINSNASIPFGLNSVTANHTWFNNSATVSPGLSFAWETGAKQAWIKVPKYSDILAANVSFASYNDTGATAWACNYNTSDVLGTSEANTPATYDYTGLREMRCNYTETGSEANITIVLPQSLDYSFDAVTYGYLGNSTPLLTGLLNGKTWIKGGSLNGVYWHKGYVFSPWTGNWVQFWTATYGGSPLYSINNGFPVSWSFDMYTYAPYGVLKLMFDSNDGFTSWNTHESYYAASCTPNPPYCLLPDVVNITQSDLQCLRNVSIYVGDNTTPVWNRGGEICSNWTQAREFNWTSYTTQHQRSAPVNATTTGNLIAPVLYSNSVLQAASLKLSAFGTVSWQNIEKSGAYEIGKSGNSNMTLCQEFTPTSNNVSGVAVSPLLTVDYGTIWSGEGLTAYLYQGLCNGTLLATSEMRPANPTGIPGDVTNAFSGTGNYSKLVFFDFNKTYVNTTENYSIMIACYVKVGGLYSYMCPGLDFQLDASNKTAYMGLGERLFIGNASASPVELSPTQGKLTMAVLSDDWIYNMSASYGTATWIWPGRLNNSYGETFRFNETLDSFTFNSTANPTLSNATIAFPRNVSIASAYLNVTFFAEGATLTNISIVGAGGNIFSSGSNGKSNDFASNLTALQGSCSPVNGLCFATVNVTPANGQNGTVHSLVVTYTNLSAISVLSQAQTFINSCGTDECEFPITLTSKNTSTLAQADYFYGRWTTDYQIADIGPNINQYLRTCTKDANSTCTVPINVTASGWGIVKFSSLLVNATVMLDNLFDKTFSGNTAYLAASSDKAPSTMIGIGYVFWDQSKTYCQVKNSTGSVISNVAATDSRGRKYCSSGFLTTLGEPWNWRSILLYDGPTCGTPSVSYSTLTVPQYRRYVFSTTCSGDLSIAWATLNFSGTLYNMSNKGSGLFTKNLYGIATGNYTYATFCYDSQVHNCTSASVDLSVAIEQNSSTHISVGGTTDSNSAFVYPRNLSVSAWSDCGGTTTVSVNGTDMTNPTVGWAPAVGTYNLTAVSAPVVNCTLDSSNRTIYVTVSKGTPVIKLYANGTETTKTYLQNRIANFTATLSASETLYLTSNYSGYGTRSGTGAVYNTTNLSTTGTYNFTAYFPEGANYSNVSAQMTVYVTDFNVTMPAPYNGVYFIPPNWTCSNITPLGQTSIKPALNISNPMSYDLSFNITTTEKPACMRFRFANYSSQSRGYYVNYNRTTNNASQTTWSANVTANTNYTFWLKAPKANVTLANFSVNASNAVNITVYVGGALFVRNQSFSNSSNVANFSVNATSYLSTCTAGADGNCTVPINLLPNLNRTITVSNVSWNYSRWESLPVTTSLNSTTTGAWILRVPALTWGGIWMWADFVSCPTNTDYTNLSFALDSWVV